VEALGRMPLSFVAQAVSQIKELMKILVEQGEWQGVINLQNLVKIIVASRWTLVRDRQGKPKSILAVNGQYPEETTRNQFLRQRMYEH